MKKRNTRTRSRVLVSVLLALILSLNTSLSPALPISSGGQAVTIAQRATNKPVANPPSADSTSAAVPDSVVANPPSTDKTSTAVPDSPVAARPGDGPTIRPAGQDATEVTSLEDAAALVYAHTHPAQPMSVEYKLARDIREIAQLLDWARAGDLTPADKAVVWDLLASKREELRVNDRVLAQKLEQKRAELQTAGPSSAVTQFDALVTQAQEKMTGLAQVLDEVLWTRGAGRNATLALDTARSYVAQITPPDPVSKPPPPDPPAFRLPDVDPNEFMTIVMPDETPPADSSARLYHQGEVPNGKASASPFSLGPADILSSPPTADDLAPTLEIQITQEITDLVTSLNNSPLAIYEHVRDNVEYVPYYGSLMGSTAVLWSKAGNDYDQASLLLALLRAGGIPARYARGNVAIPEAQAQNWLGVQATSEVTRMLGISGIPWGYNSGYVLKEHVWVEAYIPYGNYRGIGNDTSDYLWVPMDPSFKLKTYQEGIDVSGCGEFDYDSYLASIQRFLPHELYQDQIRECLNANYPGKTLADVGYVGTINESNFDFLPSSLPYPTISDVTEFAEVDDSLRHKVAITLTEDSTTLFETTLTLPEVSLDRLTVSYESVGGDTRQPVLKRNGVTLATGSNTTLGNNNTLTFGLIVPGKDEVDETVYPRLTVGEHHALGFYVHQMSQRLLDERSQQLLDAVELIGTLDEDSDDLTGELLFIALIKYNMRVDEALQAVDEIKKYVTLSETRIGVTKAAVDVEYIADIPFAIFPAELLIDFKRNVVYPAPVDGDHSDPSRQQSLMRLGGYSVSALEHQIWEDLVKLDSISTMKGLQKANEDGLTVHVCTDASCINGTQLAQSTKDKLIAEINNGQEITVPDDEFDYNDWHGAVWITRDPDTGAAGYIISGGFDGGSTTIGTPEEEQEDRLFGQGTGSDPLRTTTTIDPVNIANGNLIHTETDFTIKSRGLSLNWIRTYNNKLDYDDGPMGYGWTHSYNIHLTEDGNGNVTLMDADGARHFFTKQPDGSYSPPTGIHSTLTKSGFNFTLREKDGLEYHFDLNGRLLNISDPNGNQVSLSYDGNGNLVTITDTVERTITLAYNADNKIQTITDFTGRQWTYAYADGRGNLTSITDPAGYTPSYTYYDDSFQLPDGTAPLDHNIHTITDANGHTMTFSYYTNDKVFRHINDLGETFTLSYNPFWQETKAINEEGFARIYVYDEVGNLTKLTEETSGIRTYTWDDGRNLTSHTDPFGNVTTYTYDDKGNVLQVTNALSYTKTYEYDPTFNKPTRIDDHGKVALRVYDSHGNLVSETDAASNTTTTEYDSHGNPITMTNALYGVTVNTYDANGNLTQTNDPLNYITAFEYDQLGQLIRTVDASGHPTRYDYDVVGRPITVTNALSGTTVYAYDAVGNKTSETNARVYTTTYTYDAADRLIQVIDALEGVATYEYDGLGNLVKETDANGHSTLYEHDGLNNQTKVTDALGNATQAVYNANSNLIRQIDANGNVTTNQYDAVNRPITVTNPLSYTTAYQYDAWDNQTTVTDGNNNTTTYEYDELNRLIQETDVLSNVTGYRYDALGNTTVITDANSGVIHMVYDLNGQLISVADQLSHTTQYGYDGVGNQTVITHANGYTATLAYDALNRLTERAYPDGPKDTFTYDAVGNQLSAGNGVVTYTFQYDALNRLFQKTDSRFGKSVSYTYDDVGNRLTMSDPEGGVTTYRYDDTNRLVSITAPNGVTTFYTYDPVGNRLKKTLSNGIESTYTYDVANQLLTLVNKKANGEIISQYTYTYDGAGNRLTKTDFQGTHTYTHDDIYRLTRVDYPSSDFEVFTYDGVGNRLTKIDSSGTITYTYDDANRMLTAGSVSYGYDANGNLRSKTDADGTTQYTFDYQNRLVEIVYPAPKGLPTTDITYDPYGNRTSKTDSTGQVQYFYDDGRDVIAEYDGSGTWLTRYIHGPWMDELIAHEATAEMLYYFTDALGSVTGISDDDGYTLATYDYKVFGEIDSQSGSVDSPYGFTGRRLDPDSGLMYYRARYYDPETGRFVSSDPIGYEGGINLYTYVDNNPVNLTDPSGNNPEKKRALQDIAELWGFESLDAVLSYLGWAGGTEYKALGLFETSYMQGAFKMLTGQLALPLRGLKNTGKLAAGARVAKRWLPLGELGIEAYELAKRQDLTVEQKSAGIGTKAGLIALTLANPLIGVGVTVAELGYVAATGKSLAGEIGKWWASERNPLVSFGSELIFKAAQGYYSR